MNTRASRSQFRGIAATVAVAVTLLLAFGAAAGAATSITQPTGNPYHVALDANGKPVPFTVVASGFPFRTPVFAEECDDRPPTAPNWSPTIDCDLASGQAPVNADAKGDARFDAADPSLVLHLFSGASPQGLFNCLAPNAASPKNGLPDFHACQIRVSSNPTRLTADQTFLPIVLGASGAASSSSSSSHAALWVGLGAVVVIGAGVGVVMARRRRVSTR